MLNCSVGFDKTLIHFIQQSKENQFKNITIMILNLAMYSVELYYKMQYHILVLESSENI